MINIEVIVAREETGYELYNGYWSIFFMQYDLLKKLGIKFAFHPVESNFQTEQDAIEMAKYLCELPKPIIAYCRSGGRSTALIGLAEQLQFINLQELE